MFNKVFASHPTIYKWDRTWIGVIIGLIVPTAGILIIYLLSVMNHFMIGEAIVSIPKLIKNINSLLLLTKFLSVGCILNLGVFYLFINRDYYNVARGIIFATMIVSFPIMYVTVKSWFV